MEKKGRLITLLGYCQAWAKGTNKPTANEKWKNKTSVLVGDFLFSRAFQLMTKYGNSATLKILADTSVTISEARAA